LLEKMEVLGLSVVETIKAVPSEPSGRVRLATMEGIAAYYLTGKLVEFNTLHPQILVELVTERQPDNLTKREADVSISFVPPVGPRLDVRKAGAFRLGLFASTDYLSRRGSPKTIEELPAHDFVDYIVDLVAIAKVHWLLDVLEPEHVVCPQLQHGRTTKRCHRRTGDRPAAIFFGQDRPAAYFGVGTRGCVSNVISSSQCTKTSSSWARVRALTRFLFSLF